jgi:hypothetical protein
MLCEELKHLYTAITRAKNSVVIYDENAAARAPLYFYLARRGLARVVARSLMEVSSGGSGLRRWQGSDGHPGRKRRCVPLASPVGAWCCWQQASTWAEHAHAPADTFVL